MTRRSDEDILNLPPSKRRKVKIASKKKIYKNRPEFTRQELIDYLRSHDFRTSRELTSNREDCDPTVYDYRREFKSWKNAQELIFKGKKKECPAPESAEYLAKTLLEFDLNTVDKWLAARRKRPDVIPSINQVRKQWGSFSNLKAFVFKVYSCRLVLQEYLNLKSRLKKWPTINDCLEEGLNIDRPARLFGGKRGMDEYLKVLLRKGMTI